MYAFVMCYPFSQHDRKPFAFRLSYEFIVFIVFQKLLMLWILHLQRERNFKTCSTERYQPSREEKLQRTIFSPRFKSLRPHLVANKFIIQPLPILRNLHMVAELVVITVCPYYEPSLLQPFISLNQRKKPQETFVKWRATKLCFLALPGLHLNCQRVPKQGDKLRLQRPHRDLDLKTSQARKFDWTFIHKLFSHLIRNDHAKEEKRLKQQTNHPNLLKAQAKGCNVTPHLKIATYNKSTRLFGRVVERFLLFWTYLSNFVEYRNKMTRNKSIKRQEEYGQPENLAGKCDKIKLWHV